jgi:uncharacterized membrane protein
MSLPHVAWGFFEGFPRGSVFSSLMSSGSLAIEPVTEATRPRSASSFGVLFYGAAAILLGLIGFVWGDFATDWQHVKQGIPYHGALAYGTAALELIGGVALFWRPTARWGVGTVTLIYTVFALLWVREIVATPLVWDRWGNLFEELSIVISGAAIFASLSPPGSAWYGRTGLLCRLYGICPISFGMTHFLFIAACAPWVPEWLPFGGVFWTVATGTCFMLAAVAILTGICAGLASALNAIMIIAFEVLVWIPKVAASPQEHFMWSGNGICIALAGGAWAVADLIGRRPTPDSKSGP